MQQQSINSGVELITTSNARNGDTINGTPTGSTDTSVLRFDNVNAVTTTVIAVVTTAAAGTIATINAPGVYHVDLGLDWTGAVAVIGAIAFNQAVFPIDADPVIGVDGVIKASDVLGVAAFTGHIELSTTFYVTNAQAAAGFAVRFNATNSAGAAPAGLVVAFGQWRIFQVASLGT